MEHQDPPIPTPAPVFPMTAVSFPQRHRPSPSALERPTVYPNRPPDHRDPPLLLSRPTVMDTRSALGWSSGTPESSNLQTCLADRLAADGWMRPTCNAAGCGADAKRQCGLCSTWLCHNPQCRCPGAPGLCPRPPLDEVPGRSSELLGKGSRAQRPVAPRIIVPIHHLPMEMNRWEYPCDCPVDYPHLPIGPSRDRYVGCPFVWLTYNLISKSPDYTPPATRRPCYQVAIALVRLALLTDSHPEQLRDIRTEAGSMLRSAEELASRVAATIQRPETLLEHWNQHILTIDYSHIITAFFWRNSDWLRSGGLTLDWDGWGMAGPPPERRLLTSLRRHLRDHRRRAALILHALHRPPIGIPGDLIACIQAYGPDFRVPTTAHREAGRLVSNNLHPSRRGVDPASTLAGTAQGRYGPASTYECARAPPGP